MINRLLLVFIAAFVSGCASYSEGGLFGGFNETPLASDTYRIQAYGNAYTSRKKTNAIALVRAAELAAENGYDRFIILNYDEWAKTSFYTTPATARTTTNVYGSANTSVYGSYAHTNISGRAHSTTTINPGQTYEIEKPRTDVVVKFVRLDSRESASALLVQNIIARYGKAAGYKPADQQLAVQPNGIESAPATKQSIAQPIWIAPQAMSATNVSAINPIRSATSAENPTPRQERSIQDVYASLSAEEKLRADSMSVEERAAYLYSKRFE